MRRLNFLDCEASFGFPGWKRENAPATLEEMTEKFDRYGIDRALLRYEYSLTGVTRIGNLELLEKISGNPRFLPVWYAQPHHTGDFPAPEELLKQMEQHGVRLLTLGGGSCTVGEWTYGELFAALEAHKVPLLVPLHKVGGFAGVYDILCRHPKLRIILTAVSYTCLRDLYPLLMQFPELRVCTSGLKTQMGIENIAERFGVHRLIFGSGMPGLSGAASVALITYAQLNREQKQMIAADNLEKLLQEVAF